MKNSRKPLHEKNLGMVEPCIYTWAGDQDRWIDIVSGQIWVTYLTLYPGSSKWGFYLVSSYLLPTDMEGKVLW